jgi:hypothetical protein
MAHCAGGHRGNQQLWNFLVLHAFSRTSSLSQGLCTRSLTSLWSVLSATGNIAGLYAAISDVLSTVDRLLLGMGFRGLTGYHLL